MSDVLYENGLVLSVSMLPPGPRPMGQPHGIYYTVRPGETLERIAARFHIPLRALVAINPQLRHNHFLWPGQVIAVPTPLTLPNYRR